MHRVFVLLSSLVSTSQRRRPQCVQCTKTSKRKTQCYFSIATYRAARQQFISCVCIFSTHGNGCSAHGSRCLLPTWMENAEYSVKSPHLPPCEVKHQCFFVFFLLLKIICTTISDAHGSIFISLPTTCADVNVTGDCWKLAPFIKWCKTAGEKRREGITEYFLDCSQNLHHLQLNSNANFINGWYGMDNSMNL